MKKQFGNYSKIYDLFYQKKDYLDEVGFLLKIFGKYSRNKVKDILSLGCGTGGHDLILAKKGYQVTGVDVSKQMIEIARKKAVEKNVKIEFILSDLKKLKINKKFDVVIAMFNIAGYQNTSEDFYKFVKVSASHLKKNGLFIFDAWYQPAVLLDPPKNLKKTINLSDNHFVTRETKQNLNIFKSLLKIVFSFKEYKNKKLINEFSESHPMRFYTGTEIEYFLSSQGIGLKNICQFGSLNKKIDEKSWNMFVIGKKL